MKRIIGMMGVVLLCGMFFVSRDAGAFSVSVKNSCDRDVWAWVGGRDLFFFLGEKEYCALHMKSGETGTCKLPTGVVPRKIRGFFMAKGLGYYTPSLYYEVLWSVDAEMVQFHEEACALKYLP